MKRLLVAVLLIVVIGAAAAEIVYQGRPYWKEWTKPVPEDMTKKVVYKGRLLHDWTEDLKSDDVAVRRKAADTIAEIPPQDAKHAMAALMEGLADKDRVTRCHIAVALAHILPEIQVPPMLGLQITPALLDVLSDEDPNVRREGIDALGKFGPIAGGATRALTYMTKNDKDEKVRQAAAETLTKVHPGDADQPADSKPERRRADARGPAGPAPRIP
jgi:HEAT repeat protein